MKAGLDSNILAYAEGVNGFEGRRAALGLLRTLPRAAVAVPVQALGELFNVLVRKAKRPRAEARRSVLAWRDIYAPIETTSPVIAAALDLAADHQMRIWDSVIMSAAAEAGCRVLLSEDMHVGFTWRGVTVVNPFSHSLDPLHERLLAAVRGGG